jgi:Asp-tRNA(Asn)/Glu-tRNA(Gln) amidotransferase A subunit family amidase
MDNLLTLTETLQFPPEEQATNARLLAALPDGSSIVKRGRIVDYEVIEMAALLRSGDLTSIEITVAYLNRIDLFNGTFETYDENGGYNAFVRIDAQQALMQAQLADLWLQNPNDERGPAPPLCGIPLGAKDSIAIEGRKSTNGSEAFSLNLALKDATCVAKLRAQGAVLLGHTTCSAHSGITTGTFAGNAWDPDRIPGGSSQGSGVAPIARLAAAALGEETGGSLIIPTAANGASGIKPSLGLVSVAGLMPGQNGLDVIGPIGRSMRDASLLLSIISGTDQVNDPHTLSVPIPLPALPITPSDHPKPLAGLTIGIPQQDWMRQSNTPPAETYDVDYRAAFDRFKGQLTELGATLIDFPFLDFDDPEDAPFASVQLLGVLLDKRGNERPITQMSAVFMSNLFETGQGPAIEAFANNIAPEHKAELMQQYDLENFAHVNGAIPLAWRVIGESRRRLEQASCQQALDAAGVDFMMVMPLGAHIGQRFSDVCGPMIPNQRAHYTSPNLQGWPMLSFPIGYGQTGVPLKLPINAAFWGPRFSEPLIIQAAIDFQHHFPDYHNDAPPDPAFTTRRPATVPRVQPETPENTTNPLVKHRARS